MKPKRKLIIISLLALAIALGLGFHWLFTSPNPEALTALKSVSTPKNDTTTKQTAEPMDHTDGPYWQKHYNRALHFINLNLFDSLCYELDCLGSMPQRESELLLEEAVRNNAVEFVAELVKRNKSASGFSLHLQSYNGNFIEEYINLKTFRYIVAEGLYKFPKTEDSILSLIAAIKYKNTDLINFWLLNGCDSHLDSMVVFCPSECYDEFHSPLSMAISQCDTLLIRKFLGMGATLKPLHFDYAAHSCKTFIYKILHNELNWPSSAILYNQLHGCAYNGDLAGVIDVLKLGAELNLPDSINRTPIFNAIDGGFCGASRNERGKFDVLKFLVQKGLDINYQDRDGITPLMLSSKNFGYYNEVISKLYVARYLLDNGASTELKDNNGNSFWDHILINKNYEFIDFFLKDTRTPDDARRKLKAFAKRITPEQRQAWDNCIYRTQDFYN